MSKYLKGAVTPPDGIGISTDTILDGYLRFNVERSRFEQPPFVGVFDLYNGTTLVMAAITAGFAEDNADVTQLEGLFIADAQKYNPYIAVLTVEEDSDV